MTTNTPAVMTTPRGFAGLGDPGMRLYQNRFDVNALRTNTILSKDEWIAFDSAIVEPARQRMKAVDALFSQGLVVNVPRAMGKTKFEWEDIDDFSDAEETMDGINQTEYDRINFNLQDIPIHVTSKEFFLNLRHLEASRDRGDPLDTSHAEQASIKVAEKIENAFFNGAAPVVGGAQAEGIANKTNRIEKNFTDTSGGYNGSAWSVGTVTTADIRSDVLQMKQELLNVGFFGPYTLYVSTNNETRLDEVFDSSGSTSDTVRDSIMRISGITDIQTSDWLDDDNVLLVQTTSDVVRMINGQEPTMVEWEVKGGWRMNFQIFAIQVPNVRDKLDTAGNRTAGIVHLT